MSEAKRLEIVRLMLLSIKPWHVQNILDGKKSVELRRVRPHIAAGQPVAVYATLPAASVVATCRIRRVDVGPPSAIKAQFLDNAAISAKEFDSYFAGSNYAVAIHLDNIVTLKEPVTLGEMRYRRSSYNPPQTWHFFDRAQLRDLLGDHKAHRDLSALLN